MIAPEVIVYVDQFGNPMYTSTAGQAPATAVAAASTPISISSAAAVTSAVNVVVVVQTTAPAAVAASSAAAVQTSAAVVVAAPAPSSSAAVVVAAAAPVSSSAAAATSSAAASTSNNAGSGYAITYSPYNADGTCKSQAQVNSDFTKLSGYSMVRIYGVDCNQVVTVGSAAKAAGMKLFAGIFDIGQVTSEVATFVAACAGDFSHVHTVSIGNELVNSGQATVAQVVSAVNTARSLLKAAGYTGNVVTVDTFGAIMANPALCQASDYAAANAHAFFNSLTTAAQAGQFVLGAAQAVSKACGGMNTMITETGWPSQGNNNGAAVPSYNNQQTAIASIKAAFSNNVILYTAFNDLWKTDNSYTFGAEKYWGVYGTSSN